VRCERFPPLGAPGQIRELGISGICDNAVGRFSARHAVRWEHGRVTDIDNLGGGAWHTPMAVSRRGLVVGFSNLPGDTGGRFNAHAFLWTKRDGITDLGTLPGDTTSQVLGVNARCQVVGLSCGARGCRAFLWQHGVMHDLNTLVAHGHAGHLSSANDINDAGVITGEALDPQTGHSRAFTATPIATHGKARTAGFIGTPCCFPDSICEGRSQMLPRLAYLTLCRAMQLLARLARPDAAKELEILCCATSCMNRFLHPTGAAARN
jgi:probable HAF family extracellular repeat protein